MIFKKCESHRWPGLSIIRCLRSCGKIEVFQCNNCLALKIIQTIDLKNDKNGWIQQEQISYVEDPH